MLKSRASWRFVNNDNEEESLSTEHLSIIERLFIARGLNDEEEREKFLNPKLNDLASPKYLFQIEKVKARIEEAIEQDEQVVIYGDYDADGVTATTVLVKTLRQLGVNCHYYIPNRFKEGYGLNGQAVEHFAEQNVALIITVDNGIANVDEVQLANDLGIDVIITDHHEVQDELPNAYAIIHPALSENYTYKHLAGVGIAWQVANYLLDEPPIHLLDLVAIGTVADLVPLTGENRIFVFEGLKQINRTQIIGLKKLIEQAKIEQKITERDIGFGIGPRINSAGRLEDASLAVRLLLTEDKNEASMIAAEIEELNNERQQIVQSIVSEAEKRVNEADSFIVLADESWHEGVLGIAASRLVNTFYRPVMLLTENNETNEWKGSARSVPGFNLFESCMKIKHLFTNVGGHSQAAGMTLPKENLSEIKSFLNEQMNEHFPGKIGKQEIQIDHTITLDCMTEQFVHDMMKFAPFGTGNEKPLFYLEASPKKVRQLGQDKRHLKLQFDDADRNVEAIGFQLGHLAHFISQDATVSLVGELQLNEWNGKVTVQLNMKDIAINERQLFDYRGKRHVSNLLPYLHYYKSNVLVCNKTEDVKDISFLENVQLVTYDSDINFINKTDLLLIYDLPPNLKQLQKIIEQTNPSSIHVAYQVTENAFLQKTPSREQFKAVYVYLASYHSVPLKQHYPNMIKTTRLQKEQISFILKVFYDLNIISVNNHVVSLNRKAKKTDLLNSVTYQKRLEQSEVEKILYYSTQSELKDWFIQQTERTKGEEIIYEF